MAKDRNIYPLRLDNEIAEQVKIMYKSDNCSSQNEFIEKAIKFYISYLTTQNNISFLNPLLLNAVKSSIKENENRVSNNLFRLTVEMSMIMHILAQGLEVDMDELKKLRINCTSELKNTKGKIRIDDIIGDE